MNKILAISVATALCLGVVGHAVAGNNPAAQLALDMQAKSKTRSCATMAGTYTSCSLINRSVSGITGAQTLDVTPVVYSFTGMTAITFGLDWQDSGVFYAPAWTKCSDLDITRFAATEASITVSWSVCQQPTTAQGQAVGFLRFTTYGLPGRIHVKNPDGEVEPIVVDCSFQNDFVHTTHDGYLNGATPGGGLGELDPCTAGPTATQATTWSGVKALYR